MIDTSGWIEKVTRANRNLEAALEMMDACRRDREEASATGAMRDAREWMESAARELVDAIAGRVQSTATNAYPPPFHHRPEGPGWQSVTSGLPASDDADSNGDVLWLRSGIEVLGRVGNGKPTDATHWKRTGRSATVAASSQVNCDECGGSGDSHRYSADIECRACGGTGVQAAH